MAAQDTLRYFPVRARAEPIRMMYALADKPLTEEIVTLNQWGEKKAEQPLGQLPVYMCEKGELLMSNSIARYVAKEFGMFGGNLWEEALNDQIVETCIDYFFRQLVPKVYLWKVFKRQPEPEDSAKVLEEVKVEVLKGLKYIQSVAEKRGARFLTCDKMSLADLWLYNSLQWSTVAFPDMMEINPWVKEFVAKMEGCEKLKNYLANRPESKIGL